MYRTIPTIFQVKQGTVSTIAVVTYYLPLVQKSAFVSRQLLYAIKLCCHRHHGKYAIASFSACICNRYLSWTLDINILVLSEAHTLDIYLVIPTVTLWNLCYKIWHTKLINPFASKYSQAYTLTPLITICMAKYLLVVLLSQWSMKCWLKLSNIGAGGMEMPYKYLNTEGTDQNITMGVKVFL